MTFSIAITVIMMTVLVVRQSVSMNNVSQYSFAVDALHLQQSAGEQFTDGDDIIMDCYFTPGTNINVNYISLTKSMIPNDIGLTFIRYNSNNNNKTDNQCIKNYKYLPGQQNVIIDINTIDNLRINITGSQKALEGWYGCRVELELNGTVWQSTLRQVELKYKKYGLLRKAYDKIRSFFNY
ncbi:uncharacterized protein LOC128953194 [Oppia nitens]|uniref:uncharacterized protein LOC128953194 n=1 Tax=Oppia nitens TaxID=1686743 RepID=UPI0023DCE558|nr:uncharacterized protein LOC128953194 [Oppia nitens]